jgi:hypothetical protein
MRNIETSAPDAAVWEIFRQYMRKEHERAVLEETRYPSGATRLEEIRLAQWRIRDQLGEALFNRLAAEWL